MVAVRSSLLVITAIVLVPVRVVVILALRPGRARPATPLSRSRTSTNVFTQHRHAQVAAQQPRGHARRW